MTEDTIPEQPAEEAPANEALAEHIPSPAEALEMFAANPGLWAVTTTAGVLTRS